VESGAGLHRVRDLQRGNALADRDRARLRGPGRVRCRTTFSPIRRSSR
jgi:hypothetical protein